ncbi:MAG: hypothetical protein IPK16_02365 [Anaerolineales bacterium]|nr:hypothetical protein [Anaerolineales bacterium]
MKTYFYERTAYALSDQPVPSCFMRLDDHFDLNFTGYEEAMRHRAVVMAEAICGRMADVEMYAFLIEDARKRHAIDAKGDDKAAILTRSFLVGYLGAGRAFLDAVAVTLSTLYVLPLSNAEQTFSNGDFWHQLVSNNPNVHRRYHALRMFIIEFLRWSAETPQHVAPLSVVQNHFGRFAPRAQRLQVIDDPDAMLGEISDSSRTYRWLDPLQLHDRWKPQFMTLCDKICVDLERDVNAS